MNTGTSLDQIDDGSGPLVNSAWEIAQYGILMGEPATEVKVGPEPEVNP